jgi:hypothetical protein
VTTDLTESISTDTRKEIKFARIKLSSLDSDSDPIPIDKLFNDIIETVLKCEPFCIKLQSRLILDKETCMAYITEY